MTGPGRRLLDPARPVRRPIDRWSHRQPRQPSPARSRALAAGGRAVLVSGFWLGLFLSVRACWYGDPPVGFGSAAGAVDAVARVSGMAAGYVLLIQVLLTTRVRGIDRSLGAGRIVRLHRIFGASVLFGVLIHAAGKVVGVSLTQHASVWSATGTVVLTFPAMISATVATGILVGIGVLAIRAVRGVLPYEIWYRLHLATYLILLLSYGHQFAGPDLSPPGLARTLWIFLYVLVLAAFLWGRVFAPLRLNLRHRLRVAEVFDEGGEMFSVYVAGHRLGELGARAGQFFRWRFMSRYGWAQAHPFSLSAAPNGQWLRLTIKSVGEYTEQLRWLEPGVRVLVSVPAGAFTADRRTRHHAMLIAAGSGIGPIRALLEDLPQGTVVVYRASDAEDLVFSAELNYLAAMRGAQIHYVVGKRDDPGPRTVMTPKGMRRLVPDISRRDIYLCGPPGMIGAALDLLRQMHVPRRQIHVDPFDL